MKILLIVVLSLLLTSSVTAMTLDRNEETRDYHNLIRKRIKEIRCRIAMRREERIENKYLYYRETEDWDKADFWYARLRKQAARTRELCGINI